MTDPRVVQPAKLPRILSISSVATLVILVLLFGGWFLLFVVLNGVMLPEHLALVLYTFFWPVIVPFALLTLFGFLVWDLFLLLRRPASRTWANIAVATVALFALSVGIWWWLVEISAPPGPAL